MKRTLSLLSLLLLTGCKVELRPTFTPDPSQSLAIQLNVYRQINSRTLLTETEIDEPKEAIRVFTKDPNELPESDLFSRIALNHDYTEFELIVVPTETGGYTQTFEFK